MEKRQSFIKGTFILFFANIIVKITGAIFKIPLSNLIGADGIGTFSVAYNLYAVMFVISTAGLPVAISKLISQAVIKGRDCDVPRIIKCAFAIFFTLSLLITISIFAFAKEICMIIGNENAYLSIVVVSPSIILVSLISIIRGYYQGYQNMTKTAVSQVIEAVSKLLVGYFFASYLISQGYSYEIAAAGAILGVTIGTTLSAVYLLVNVLFFRQRYTKNPVTSKKIISKKIAKIAVPITVTASLLSLTGIIDMFTIMNRLSSINISLNISNSMYGAYNMALTLYNLPQTIITAISISLIPKLSGYFANNNTLSINKTVNTSLFLTTTFSFPSAVGFILLAKPILDLLYYKRPEDVLIATPILIILGFAITLVSIVTITNACMQSLNYAFLPIKAMILGLFVKFLANYILIANTKINVSGAAFGTVLCFLIIAIINLKNLSKLNIHINLDKIIVKPLISSLIMGVFIIYLKSVLNMEQKISLIIIIFLSIILYFFINILVKSFDKEDLKILFNKK